MNDEDIDASKKVCKVLVYVDTRQYTGKCMTGDLAAHFYVVVHKVPLPQLPRECDVSKNKNIVCSRASNDDP